MLRFPRRPVTAMALALMVGACADAPRDPVAVLVAPEARAALEVGSTLPTLPDLIRKNTPGGVSTGDLARAEALWRAGEQASGAEAGELRREADSLAAAPLAAAMDSASLAEAQERLESWISLAGGALGRGQFPELTAALGEAGEFLAGARGANARGERTASVALTLLAADRLAETTPRAVADRLTGGDEVSLAALRGLPGVPSDQESRLRLERIERLVRGAREALAGGRYEVAIRRAYYARELLASEHALVAGGMH